MRDTFARTLYQIACRTRGSSSSSPTSHRPEHGQVPPGVPRAVRQRRGGRAKHDRPLRGARPAGLPSVRVHDRDVHDLPSVRAGARRPLLPERAGHPRRDRRRRHLLDPGRYAPRAGGHRPDGGDPEHGDHRPLRPDGDRGRNLGLRRPDGPTYLRLGKTGEPTLSADAPEPFEFGKTRTLRKEGPTSASSPTDRS